MLKPFLFIFNEKTMVQKYLKVETAELPIVSPEYPGGAERFDV